MWSDNETTLDLLGFRVHADLIRSLVTNPQMLPVTVGIFGDWGSGKTSIMNMLREDLDPKRYPEGSELRAQYEDIVCIYFNGWLFEGYDDAKSALLSSVLAQLKNNRKVKEKCADKISQLIKSVNWMRLARFGFKEVAVPTLLAYFSGGASLVPTVVDKLKGALGENAKTSTNDGLLDALIQPHDSTESDPSDVRAFRSRFAELLAESDIKSLVILIDDLDRCSPQRIIDNLEAIKLFLSVERTAFVIGADRRIVRHAIATVYRPTEIQESADKSDQSTNIVDDYLEKLIQVPYRLPRLSDSEVQTYMSLLFCERHLKPELYDKICEAAQRHCREDRYRTFGYGSIQEVLGGDLSAELDQSLRFCTHVAPLMTEGLKGNPRQIKRFLNAYVLRKQLADVAKLTNIRDDVLVKLMVLEYVHPDQFNQLYGWQSSHDGMPKQLHDLEATRDPVENAPNYESVAQPLGIEWSASAMKRWIFSEPLLSEVDLRDYFWVARDRLLSSISQLTLVPQNLRQIVEKLISEVSAERTNGIALIKERSVDDQSQVYRLLGQKILTNPDSISAFNGVFELIEAQVPGSIELLVQVLDKAPRDNFKPSVGIMLSMLLKAHPEYQIKLQSITDKLRSENTRLARAFVGGNKQ